jgi:hypothetical protein
VERSGAETEDGGAVEEEPMGGRWNLEALC